MKGAALRLARTTTIAMAVGVAGLLGSAVLATTSAAASGPSGAVSVLSEPPPKPLPKPKRERKERQAGQDALHAPCGTAGPNLDSDTGNTNTNNVNMRSGSSTGCASNGQAHTFHTLDYHCFTLANDGFTWTYARNVNTGVRGWIRDDLLADFGSFVYCGF
jgi:hypothetical protein